VLSREVEAELARPVDRPSFRVLEDVARGDVLVSKLMAPVLLGELEKRPALATTFLGRTLDIIVRGLPPEQELLKELAIGRFGSAVDPGTAGLYIAAVFAVDGAAGTDAVLAKLQKLKPEERPVFVQRILVRVFGSQFWEGVPKVENLPLSSLEQLVQLAFANIRVDDDKVRVSGDVFSPDERDDAENARNVVFNLLVKAPYEALRERL
jgi:putative transposase